MLQRLVEKRVIDALATNKVVLLCGPRQSGKTTLAEKIAGSEKKILKLDNSTLSASARKDPVGFIEKNSGAFVLDEIQRVPELIPVIKSKVEGDNKSGKFLLTGSTNITTKPFVVDKLGKNIASVLLLPFSQSELQSGQGTFLDDIFHANYTQSDRLQIGDELINLVFDGGYPEALKRPNKKRRYAWYRNYVNDIIHHDVPEFTQLNYANELPKLLEIVAQYSGKIMNYSEIGSVLGLTHVTVQRYIDVLEQLFLVDTLPAWGTNFSDRFVKKPKQHLLDTGLLTSLRQITIENVSDDRTIFGPILETFVISEFRKLATWSKQGYRFFHLRDRNGNEVDIVAENLNHQIVGFEIKASSTVTNSDFKHLRRLAKITGKKFVQGIVLYDGEHVAPFGDKMVAVPLSHIWR